MEYNEDRNSVKNIPTFTLPPSPRFDAAASAAARPVEPLATTRIQIDLPQKPKSTRLINRRSKFLALMAIVGLATGAAGGILVVERDKQHQFENSASTIQIPVEQTPDFDSGAPALENNDASLEVSQPVENQVPVRQYRRRAHKQPKRELVVRSDADEEADEEEEWDRDEDDDDDKKDEDRKNDRDRDRDGDADSYRNDRSRRRAVLYDVLRTRKP